jgi:hypothetical protein
MQKKDEKSDTVHHKATKDASCAQYTQQLPSYAEFITTKTQTTHPSKALEKEGIENYDVREVIEERVV